MPSPAAENPVYPPLRGRAGLGPSRDAKAHPCGEDVIRRQVASIALVRHRNDVGVHGVPRIPEEA